MTREVTWTAALATTLVATTLVVTMHVVTSTGYRLAPPTRRRWAAVAVAATCGHEGSPRVATHVVT
jgi:hypothetical protein